MLYSSSSFRSDVLELAPVSRPVSGTPWLPGSKSITNRALLIAALANGETHLTGALFSDDTRYMAAALNQLGIVVYSDPQAESFRVTGSDGSIPATDADLFVGNSGTTIRFLTAAVALGHGTFRLDGVPRMRERPIQPLIEALTSLGVDATSDNSTGCPPITVRSQGLSGGSVRVRGDISSQYITGLLLAAPCATSDLTIDIDGELVSRPYVDMTLDMMAEFGVEGTVATEDPLRYVVRAPQAYTARVYHIEPDASAASYFFAAAAVTGGSVTVQGLGENSLQGDLFFVDILEDMGCKVVMSEDQTTVSGPADGVLLGGDFDMADVSDTAQTLAAIAPFASSPVTIRGVAHNRVKETDRISAVATELRKIGQDVEEFEDGMTITPAPIIPADIETYDDHRMAMAFGVTGLRAHGMRILDPGCTAKTFPDYFRHLAEFAQTERII